MIGDLRVPRVSVRLETTATTARVMLDVVPSANPSVAQQGNARLVVRLDADAVDLLSPTVQPGPLLQAIRFNDASSVAIDPDRALRRSGLPPRRLTTAFASRSI